MSSVTDDELHAKLAGWLQSSGRALELQVARTFRRQEYVPRVDQSCHYEDVTTDVHREGDVLAVYHWIDEDLAATIEVAVECKAGRSTPWVAFYDERRFTPSAPRAWFKAVGEWPESYLAALTAEWRTIQSLTTSRVATHAVSAFGKDGKNHVSDAARQALSFARARVKGGVTRYRGDADELTVANIVMPLVVTEAPLFTCEVLSDGSIDLRRVDRFDMWIHVSQYDRRRVYVRSVDATASLARDLSLLADRMLQKPTS